MVDLKLIFFSALHLFFRRLLLAVLITVALTLMSQGAFAQTHTKALLSAGEPKNNFVDQHADVPLTLIYTAQSSEESLLGLRGLPVEDSHIKCNTQNPDKLDLRIAEAEALLAANKIA